MSPALEKEMLLHLVLTHPLPWRIEDDWCVEVRDAEGALVAKLDSHTVADELIALARNREVELNITCVEAQKLLEEV